MLGHLSVVGSTPEELAHDLLQVMQRGSGETQRDVAARQADRAQRLYGRQLVLRAPEPKAPIQLGEQGLGSGWAELLQGGRQPNLGRPVVGDEQRAAGAAAVLAVTMTDAYLFPSGTFRHELQLGDVAYGLAAPLMLDSLEQCRCALGAAWLRGGVPAQHTFHILSALLTQAGLPCPALPLPASLDVLINFWGASRFRLPMLACMASVHLPAASTGELLGGLLRDAFNIGKGEGGKTHAFGPKEAAIVRCGAWGRGSGV